MASSIKDGRVAKSKAKSSSQSGSLRRSLSMQKGLENSKPKPLPLVESTNALTLEQFITSYIQPSTLQIKTGQQNDSPTRDNPQNTEPGKEPCYKLDVHTAASIPKADFEACFQLIEAMAEDYAASGVGWSHSKKRQEMSFPDMKYLILRSGRSESESESESAGGVLGFLSFMVTYEDGHEVIYLYEIHLSSVVRGNGLGGQMMLKLEEIGRRIGLEKVMLTVFKSNPGAMRLYERVGFTVDDFSPPPRLLRNGTVKAPGYLILSKSLRSEH